MKIDEVLVEKQLDEVPAGGLGQMAKKVGSRLLNKVPGAAAKSKAANIAGQADLGDTANKLHKDFNAFLGTQGKKMAQATGEDLGAFLKTKKHSTKATIPSGVLQKQQLNDVLMAVAKEALAGQGGSGGGSAPAGGGEQPKGQAQQQGGAAQQQGAGGAAQSAIPDNIQKQLDTLTPTEKKALAGMLS